MLSTEPLSSARVTPDIVQVEVQQRLVRHGHWRCCLNCLAFKKEANLCLLHNATPPAEVILHGCQQWDDLPF